MLMLFAYYRLNYDMTGWDVTQIPFPGCFFPLVQVEVAKQWNIILFVAPNVGLKMEHYL